MGTPSPVVLGLAGVLLGVAFFALAFFLLRTVPRLQPIEQPVTPPPLPPGMTSITDAILLIHAGGRVVFTNQIAREWFGMLEEEPNLERLARRARPSEIFMGLCASEGQARFSLNGIFVEGTSYFIPYDGSSALLVSLHRPQVTSLGKGESGATQVSEQAIDILAELTRAMASSLDLKSTLQAVLESVERLIPSDYPEITLWEADSQTLTPYRFVGMVGVDRHLEKSQERYRADQGYSGYLVRMRIPLVINNVDTFREVRPSIDRKQYPFNAYMGIPLLVANELVGTLELASLTRNAFNQNDLEVLRILSGQAAVAIHNALQYQEEQRRGLELSGLAQLAYAVSAIHDPKDLYGRLVESLKPLLDAEIVGFWVYDEAQHVLEPKVPFVGIPQQFLENYNVPIPPDSPAEEILKTQENLTSTDASVDERMEKLGFSNFAMAAGIHGTVLLPIAPGGRLLGYLEASNKPDNAPFDQNDLRILAIIAGQAAIIIENATLVQQTQRRAQRAEALRRIASLTGSAATLDEVLLFSLREIARLLTADSAAIFLLDENRGAMRLHKESVFGVKSEAAQRLSRFSFNPYQTGKEAARSLISAGAALDESLPSYYHPMIDILQIQSMIKVPLVVRDQAIGEVILGSQKENFFDRSDLITVDTAAGQLAAAIEQSSLSTQTDDTLRRRIDQLTAITRISRELNTSLELPHLLQRVFDELVHTTSADCGTIMLLDTSLNPQAGRPREIHRAHLAATSEPAPEPQVVLQIGDTHEVELSPLEKNVLDQEEPLIVNDYEQLLNSPAGLKPPHDKVRSAIIVPIAYQERAAGLIHLHANTPNRFDMTSLEIAQTLAIQAAIAMGNAQRYQEQVKRSELLNRRVETLANLLETTQALQSDQPIEDSMEAIAYGIQESTPFNVVLVSIYDAQSGNLKRVAGAGLTLDQMETARQTEQPWNGIEVLLKPEFRIGKSYFIPKDKTPILPPEVHFIYATPLDNKLSGETAWDPDDFMLIPLTDASGQKFGLISVDNPRDGLRPDRPTIETLEIFATQAALAIENFQKLNILKEQSEVIDHELDLAKRAADSALTTLPVLLHKDLEQTLAIQNLSQRARKIRASLDIAEVINRQPERVQVLGALAQELLTRMDFNIALVAEPSPRGPRLVQSLGSIPTGINPEAYLGQRNPLRYTLQNGEAIFVSTLEEDPDWQNSSLLLALEAKAFVCLPIQASTSEDSVDTNIDSVIMAVRLASYEPISPEDQQLYTLLARQAGAALQNLRLISETSRRLQEVNILLDFSRKLGSLDPISILHTLMESARQVIPGATHSVAALWDAKQGCLVPLVAQGYPDLQSVLQITYQSGEALPGQVFQQGQPVRLDDVDFARQYQLPPDRLLLYRNATQGRLPISTLVVPITAGAYAPGAEGGEDHGGYASPLGVILLENFQTPAAFSADDEALVTSLAQQTALTLENARLYQASEQRANQLRTLTNVAGTITSSLQSNELIASLLDQAKAVIPYDTGTLWLRQEKQLTIRAARGFEDSEERVGLSVAFEDSLLLLEMIETGKPISVPDVRKDERFPSLVEHEYFSWMGIPIISKGEVAGVIALEKIEPNFYSDEHIQAVTTFAGQAAVALENARLYEESVQRALELDQRSQRLAVLNSLSTELSGSLDLGYILQVTILELTKTVKSTAATAILFDTGEQANVQAETPHTSLALPRRLPEAPIYERIREALGVFNLEDVLDEYGKITSPLLAPLEGYLLDRNTRALLALPLATGSNLHGIILVHNNQPYRFSPDEVELARTISNQAAVAIQNATLFEETQRLFAETRQRSAELATLFDLGVNVSQVLDLQQLVNITFDNVRGLVPFDAVSLVLRDEKGQMAAQATDHGERVGPLLLAEYGESYSQNVITTGHPLVVEDVSQDQTEGQFAGRTLSALTRSWLGVPLVVRGATIGVLCVESDQPEQYHEAHVRLITQVANQLAVALDNARLFTEVQTYAAGLQERVTERTAQLEREHQRSQTLLDIITELSTSLEMDLVLNRTLALVNKSTQSDHSLIMLVNPDTNELFQRASLGYADKVSKGNPIPFYKSHEALAIWAMKQRQSVLIEDLAVDERWTKEKDGASGKLSRKVEQPRSAIAVPLMMGEDTLGVLLLYNRRQGNYSPDMLDLVQAIAKQITVAINNSQLFSLIRDQAERLGDMLRTQHVETIRSQAILEAVADGVLVTDRERVITLFNASAESILGLNRKQVLGRTLEHFSGLFGKAGQPWMETIRRWSDDPAAFKTGEVGAAYSEQIEMEDKRVVSVHLSPVTLRNDFLGTVSIFSDITHQVEVDRLKSEFVATVSHELRTPMTSIKGYVEIMLMGASGPMSDQQTHFLEIVKSNTERLAILVNDLLDISRIEAGKVTLSMQPIDLREIARQAIADLIKRTQDDQKPMDIQTHLPDTLPLVYGDKERVRQILDNLLENAYYYTPDHGHIDLKVHSAGGEVQVDVKDNGIGILPKDQPRVFERFYRGEDPLVLATSGTGLGLSIVSRLIEMHKGRIWIHSQGVPGKGSTFSFTLPVHSTDKGSRPSN
jgi:PAS domain S-box-containing protein